MKEENDLDVIFGGTQPSSEFDESSMLSPATSDKVADYQAPSGRITTIELKNQVYKNNTIVFTLESPSIKCNNYGKTTIKGKLVPWVESGLFSAVITNKLSLPSEDWYISSIDGNVIGGWYIKEIFVSNRKVRLKVVR